MNKADKIKELEAKGVVVPEGAKADVVNALYAEHFEADEDDGENSNGAVVIWLKVRAYISDTERVEKGVYAVDAVPERLRKLGKADVEIFEGDVPTGKLIAMAKWCGIGNADDLEPEQIFSKVVSTAYNVVR